MFGIWEAMKIFGRFSHLTFYQCMYEYVTFVIYCLFQYLKSDLIDLFICFFSFVLLRQRHDHLKDS